MHSATTQAEGVDEYYDPAAWEESNQEDIALNTEHNTRLLVGDTADEHQQRAKKQKTALEWYAARFLKDPATVNYVQTLQGRISQPMAFLPGVHFLTGLHFKLRPNTEGRRVLVVEAAVVVG
jgi:hypothetical protein